MTPTRRELLGIMLLSTLRPGDDVPTKPVPLNLPDPLVLANGARVSSPEIWRTKRRPEILEWFRANVYGRTAIKRPADLQFAVETTPKVMGGKATRKQITASFSGPGGKGTLRFLVFLPANASSPVPAFLLINNREASHADPDRSIKSDFWPAEEIVARGCAAVAIHVSETDPDSDDGFKNGVHGIFDTKRSGESWGSLAAWAWGASRVQDYLETDKAIDSKRVAVVGHSRGGKAALWAGAEDERFSLVVSNNSGCTGAALSRGKTGETIAQITQKFPYWFCENYQKWAGREAALPFDQHELLALIAPRLLYVASATNDAWADPASEFQGCVAASPVYELLGQKGVESNKMPLPEKPLVSGTIGYHLRTGNHDLTRWDWEQYINFGLRHWNGK